MIQLFSKEDFDKAKTKELLDLQCEFCSNPFKATKNAIQMSLKGDKFRNIYKTREIFKIKIQIE